jgi:hypothetical protein
MSAREFVNEDLAGAVFREVDLTGARMFGVLLTNADLDGDIAGLRVNGVEVAPLVEADLDRRHPERAALRPTTVDGLREALVVWDDLWRPTLARAVALGEKVLHARVNDEWSFVETRRHLIFVVDAWFGHAILGDSQPFHPIGLPATFFADGASFGIDPTASPTFVEVEDVLAGRFAALRDFAGAAVQDDLDQIRPHNPAPGYPAPADRTALQCLRVIFSDGWKHHRFAVRDLSTLETRERPAIADEA